MLMLWSAPRSRSTAFFRMMTQRGDFTTVHEPFSYLAEFGYADVAGERLTSAPELIAALCSPARSQPVFAKETTGKHYPEVLAHRDFLTSGALHTFLIRHPRETIVSYLALNPDAALHKIGFESQYEIFAGVSRLTGRDPVVVDSDDLITRPAATIGAYCARAGIEFRPDALTWPPADRPEWEPSRRWHADVAASTGFGHVAAKPGPDIRRHPVLSGYLDYHLPFYEMLYARRLMV
jgi:Sulfotransferase domain